MYSESKWALGSAPYATAALAGLIWTLGCSSDSGGKSGDDTNCSGASCAGSPSTGGSSGSGGSTSTGGSSGSSGSTGVGCPGADGKALPSGEVLYEIPGDIADIDRAGDQLYYVSIPSFMGGPGTGGVFRAPAAGGGTFQEVVAYDDYQISNLSMLKDSFFGDTGLEGIYQFSLDGSLIGDRSAAGDHSRSDGEAVYAWFDDSICADSVKFGLNRVDADGTITSIDAQAHCIQDVAVGGDYVYWLQGDHYGDIDPSLTKIALYRAPKAGGGSRETLPLTVSTWASLEWTDGYVVGQTLADFARGRPDDDAPTFIGHGVSELSGDGAGTAFFSDGSDTYGCLVHVQGSGDVVRDASFDPVTSRVNLIAAYPDYVYFTVDANEENGLDRTTILHRLAR